MSNLCDYWCRWKSDLPLTTFEYHGPWWISGETSTGPIICAAVCAETEEQAEELFRKSYDSVPDFLPNFSCDLMSMSDPFTSRFPKRDWMIWPITPKEAMERRGS